MKLIVTAPGTTANIGPGYDCLGLALTLYGMRVRKMDLIDRPC